MADKLSEISIIKQKLKYQTSTDINKTCATCAHSVVGWSNVRCAIIKAIVKRNGICRLFKQGESV